VRPKVKIDPMARDGKPKPGRSTHIETLSRRNPMTRLPLVTAAAALLLALPVAAQDAPAPRLDFAAIDTNGDGAISLEEWRAHAATRATEGAGREGMAQRMMRHDTDGDGLLSPAEIETAMQSRMENRETRGAQRMERMFARIDRNDDGQLSPAELDAARAHFAERMDRGHGRGQDGARGHGWRN